jgi:hypothetical protein
MPEKDYSKLTWQEYQDLSKARDLEEHHRALLLFWKKRRQKLEAKLIDNPLAEIEKLANEQWNKTSNDD